MKGVNNKMENTVVNCAKLIIGNASILVQFDDKDSTEIVIKRRKTWSNKKYVGKALEETGFKPSWDFKYDWELR